MAFTLNIKGIEGLQKKLEQFPDKTEAAVAGVLADAATAINAEQVQNASRFTDRGSIVQGLGIERKAAMDLRLFAQAPHSAYLEFGTRKKFTPIPEVDANPYRGSGKGGGKGFYDAILRWVKRKGIAQGTRYSVKTRRKLGGKKQQEAEKAAAYAIYLSILRNGIKPQPFFFAPFLKRRQSIIKEVEAAINKIL